MANFMYLLGDPKSREAVVVDPVVQEVSRPAKS